MARLTIGLDISGKNWKSVVLSGGGKSTRKILAHASGPAPDSSFDKIFEPDLDDPVFEGNLYEWSRKLVESVGEDIRNGASLVIGIPQKEVCLRVLELPFTQAAKIERILPFEIEGEIPFDTEDMIFDFMPLIQTDGHTRGLVASMKRDSVAGLLDHLRKLSLDPAILAPTALSLGYLRELAAAEEETGRTAFLYVGGFASQLIVIENGKVISAFNLGAGVYREVSAEPEPEPPAEGKAPGGEEDTHQEPAPAARYLEVSTEAVVEALSPVLNRALHYLDGYSAFGEPVPAPLDEIILIGEGATRESLAETLAEELGVPVENFRLPPGALAEGVEMDPARAAELAPALALAMQKDAPRSRTGINFRKAEFAFHPERKALMRRLVFPAVLAVMLLVVLGYRTFAQGSSENREAEMIMDQIEQAYATRFPDEPVVNPSAQISGKIEDAKAKYQKYREMEQPRALDVLAAISSSIPEDIEVTITSFDFKGDKLSLSGVTRKLDEPNEISKRLAQTPIFYKVDLENTQKVSETEFRFKMSVSLAKEAKP